MALIALAFWMFFMGTALPGASAQPVDRSSQILLRIPGSIELEGDSTYGNINGWIELTEAELSSEVTVGDATGSSSREVSAPRLSEISILKPVDSVSAAIFKKHLSAKAAAENWEIVFPDGSGTAYLKYTLTAPVISSYQISNKSRFAPEESFTINYSTITVTTWSESGAPKSFTYDRARAVLN